MTPKKSCVVTVHRDVKRSLKRERKNKGIHTHTYVANTSKIDLRLNMRVYERMTKYDYVSDLAHLVAVCGGDDVLIDHFGEALDDECEVIVMRRDLRKEEM